ncbi:hypothetical protein HOP50_20g85390 [Chloropicon primus]|uniref:Amino acid transporter transmembrane domain-containing protein n=1 Tax=Chloropicon primus TaxID=1764295 RepID=A0A5B8MYS2_9CHLO|nr:hypothetical protein A3770_20p85060 [Chloropicon primus]UPR05189.1 hypothetical protein HOP50_20g85390 [Chloropicon primus]|mmetsp:Transcript_11056/g.30913  ORF Transcript_11056/g.30913 Transcript_11056/m.30913 type:complete len:464 (-) Transcript_11056:661-2052(-)|eukprot:QDZ25988.1 hypothetical protein A3770_20p85060 [Chloropicon primus]
MDSNSATRRPLLQDIADEANGEDHEELHKLSSRVIRRTTVLLQSRARHEDGPDEDEGARAGSTTVEAICNLVIATAGGVGMVTLPGTFSVVGYLEGFFLLVISGVCAAVSLIFLNMACRIKNENEGYASYGGLVAHTLGSLGSYTLEGLTLLYCFGQVLAYVSAVGGQLTFLSGWLGVPRNQSAAASTGCAAALMFFLSLLPEESGMRFAGALGTFCVMVIVGTVVLGDGVSALHQGPCSLASSPAVPRAFNLTASTMLKSFPIFLFSMNASVIYVPVRKEHRAGGAGPRQSRTLIGCSLVLSGLLYLACSATSYYAYCSEIPENVVDVWPIEWIPGAIARSALSMELLVAGGGIYVPLARASLQHLIRGPQANAPASPLARACMSFAFVSLGAAGSLLLRGALTLPLAVTSALCVTAQMLVLPGLILRKAHRKPWCRALGTAFALAGFMLGALSLLALFGAL